MMVWKLILDPKNPELTLEQVGQCAILLGYPMVNHGGKIYRIVAPGTPGTLSQPGEPVQTEETGSTPEMFEQPNVFCVMDTNLQKICMNELGPLLFTSPMSASLFAEKVEGVPKALNEAIYLQIQARKNESSLIVPERPIGGLIVPAR